MSYLEVYRISRAALLELARPFPVALRRIRWEALRLAMMRTLVLTKRELQQQEEQRKQTERQKTRALASDVAIPSGVAIQEGVPFVRLTPEAAEGEQQQEDALGSPRTPHEHVWQTFLEKATEPGDSSLHGSFRGSTPRIEEFSTDRTTDPSAVLENPSLHDLGRGLDEVREEMAELKQGIGMILARLGGPPVAEQVSSSVGAPANSHTMTSLFA